MTDRVGADLAVALAEWLDARDRLAGAASGGDLARQRLYAAAHRRLDTAEHALADAAADWLRQPITEPEHCAGASCPYCSGPDDHGNDCEPASRGGTQRDVLGGRP